MAFGAFDWFVRGKIGEIANTIRLVMCKVL